MTAICSLSLLNMLLQYFFFWSPYLLFRQVIRLLMYSLMLGIDIFAQRWQCTSWEFDSSMSCCAMTDYRMTSESLSFFISQMGFFMMFLCLAYMLASVPEDTVKICLPLKHFHLLPTKSFIEIALVDHIYAFQTIVLLHSCWDIFKFIDSHFDGFIKIFIAIFCYLLTPFCLALSNWLTSILARLSRFED